MNVTVEVVGETTTEVTVDETATYADLVEAVDYNPQAVSVLVEGSPVPEDQPIEAAHVQVLRLITGG